MGMSVPSLHRESIDSLIKKVCWSKIQFVKKLRQILCNFNIFHTSLLYRYIMHGMGSWCKNVSISHWPPEYPSGQSQIFGAVHVPRQGLIIESVDSICMDGADTPLSLNKSNGSELLNADILSFSDKLHALRLLLYTIVLSVYVKYSESQKFA